MVYFEVNRRRKSLVLPGAVNQEKRKVQMTHSLAFIITLPELHSYTPLGILDPGGFIILVKRI